MTLNEMDFGNILIFFLGCDIFFEDFPYREQWNQVVPLKSQALKN